MNITIPEFALVVLVGTSGAGKSTFARPHFKPTEVLSSDFCRGLVSDDENSLTATDAAFDVLHYSAAKRLAALHLTVIDATNVQPEAHKPLLALAAQYHCLPVAIVLNLPERLCHEGNAPRPDRDFGPHVIRRQHGQLRRSLHGLQREGFRYVHVLSSPEEVAAVTLIRQPLWNNRTTDHGPFDIIGDVHGCRIIYGPEYTLPANLERLRKRGLGAKRALAALWRSIEERPAVRRWPLLYYRLDSQWAIASRILPVEGP